MTEQQRQYVQQLEQAVLEAESVMADFARCFARLTKRQSALEKVLRTTVK